MNKDSRNVFTTRDHYFKKNKVISKTSKSVSELINNTENKSNYKMLLSKSNFKINKLNAIVKNIKYNTKEKEQKDVNKIINNLKKKNHHYVNSLKMINKSNTLYHNKFLKKKNNAENKIINNKKLNGRNKAIIKKQMEKLKYINSNNNNSSNMNTINDYNFNNNNSYIKKFINSNIHTFLYDSSENSKSEDKYRKIIKTSSRSGKTAFGSFFNQYFLANASSAPEFIRI